MALAIGLWAFPFILYEDPIFMDSLFWIRVIYVLVISMVGSLFYFCFAFPYNDKPKNWMLVAYFLANVLIIYLLFFTNSFVVGVDQTPSGPSTKLGLGYLAVFPCWCFFIFYGIWIMIRKFLQSRGTVRLQLLYVFLGLGIFFGGCIIFDAIIPLVFGTSRFFSLSAVCSLFFVTAASYAIVRHRLMDIKVALHSIVVFALTSSMIFIVLSSLAMIFWLSSHIPPRYEVLPTIAIMSVVMALFFERFSQAAKFIANRYLFQSVYDYEKTLSKVSTSLSSYLDLPQLTEVIVKDISDALRPNKIVLVIRDFNDRNYHIYQVNGFERQEIIALITDRFMLSYLEQRPQVLILDEVRKLVEEAKDPQDKETWAKLYQHMQAIEAALVMPVVNVGRMIAILALGDKIGGGAYTVQDINLLDTVGRQSSIALENARLYNGLASLNENLVRRVKEATSELEKKNLDLEFAYKDLKTLDSTKDQLIDIASHELRTPMTAIRSYSWMALYKSDIPLSDKMKKYLQRVLVSTERLIELVNSMLNISRIEAGRVAINAKAFDIIALAKDTLSDIEVKFKEKNIVLQIEEASVSSAFGDPDKIREVVLNLVGNALKFTPENGQINLKFKENSGFIETTVKDSGVGIPAEDIPRLFKKFGRLDGSYVAAATSGGTGLGLYIVKSMVELMKGKVWVKSEGVGKGTEFTFSLPITTKELEAQTSQTDQEPTDLPASIHAIPHPSSS